MQPDIVVALAGVTVALIFGFYTIHRSIVRDRIRLERRFSEIEGKLKEYGEFYDVAKKIAFSDFLKKGRVKKK